jgi:glutamyl-tRNA synthetase
VIAQQSLKMAQFGPAARLLVFGRAQTPTLEAMLVLMPREVVIARLGTA